MEMATPDRPPFMQWFETDGPAMEVDVYDYFGTRRSVHSYIRDINRDARDQNCGWTYRPEAWFWETRPVYPIHWHVFVLREVEHRPGLLVMP